MNNKVLDCIFKILVPVWKPSFSQAGQLSVSHDETCNMIQIYPYRNIAALANTSGKPPANSPDFWRIRQRFAKGSYFHMQMSSAANTLC